MATTSDTQPNHQESEDEDEDETYHFTVEVEDNREPQASAADVFVHTFVSTLHKWVVAGVVLLMLGALLSVIGVV